MGYYTQYTLEAKNVKTPEEFDVIRNHLADLELIDYAFDDGTYYDSEEYAIFSPWEEAKWYDHDDDMRRLSKKLPHVVFMLEGDGEDSEDRWRTYYKDGDWEVCHGHIEYSDPIKISW